MSTNSFNLITEGDLLQIPANKRTLVTVDASHLSLARSLSPTEPFTLQVFIWTRFKYDGISETSEFHTPQLCTNYEPEIMRWNQKPLEELVLIVV